MTTKDRLIQGLVAARDHLLTAIRAAEREDFDQAADDIGQSVDELRTLASELRS